MITTRGKIRESYLVNNYPLLLEKINNYLVGVDMPFVDKVYHYWHQIPQTMCQVCHVVPTTMISFKQGYRPCCSAKCTQNRELVK